MADNTARKNWPIEVIATVIRLCKEEQKQHGVARIGHILPQINQQFSVDMTKKQIARIWSAYKGKLAYRWVDDTLPPETPDVEIPEDNLFIERAAIRLQHRDKKNPKDRTFDDMMDVFEDGQEVQDDLSIRQLQASVVIEARTPIALTFITDAHLGSPSTDYRAFRNDVTAIQGHPDHFCGLGGDMADNFTPQFSDKSAPVNMLQPPQIQLLAVEKVIEYLSGKIVACIGGNHDTMDKKQTGIDARYFIQRGKEPAWLPHGGMVTLTVGDVEYKILWKHSYRFKSALNKFNSHHRMIETLAPDADIAVQEHEHNPGIESLEVGQFPKRTQINIRTGGYKIDDGYSLDFWKSGRMGPQTVILWPDKKKILALHGKDAIADAQTFLNGLTTIRKQPANPKRREAARKGARV